MNQQLQRVFVPRTWLTLLIALASVVAEAAQPAVDRAWYERLVDGAAGFVYNLAWPTATYERVAFGSIRPMASGADVTFRLHGRSAFADGDLWVDVVMHVRSGAIAGIDWGESNGFFPPGLTTVAFLRALNELVSSSSSPRPVVTPSAAPSVPTAATSTMSTGAVSVACIGNTTTNKVSFSLQRGQNRQAFSLDAGETWLFTAAPSDRNFDITFDNSFADGYQAGALRFNADVRSPKPDSCSDDVRLVFISSGDQLGITTVTWAPGFPSPFNASVLQSTEKDKWVCAAGYRPYPFETGGGLECLANGVGVVGMGLSKDPNGPFLKITSVYPRSPAAQAGLSAGLIVVSIDSVSTDSMGVSAALEKLRGPVGRSLRLGVVAPGTNPSVVTLTRQ